MQSQQIPLRSYIFTAVLRRQLANDHCSFFLSSPFFLSFQLVMTLPRNTLDRFASTVSLALRNFGRPSRATFLWIPRFLPIGLSPIAHLPSDFCRATFADQTITFQLFFANTRNMAYNKQLPLSAVSLQQFCLV